MSHLIGPVQRRILDRAKRSPYGNVMPGGFLERRACKRLENRGLLFRRLGLPDVWRVG